MQRGQFALSGTLMVDGKATAFLREVNGGKSRRVAQGETVNGMVVTEIKPDRVRLTLGDETEELSAQARSRTQGHDPARRRGRPAAPTHHRSSRPPAAGRRRRSRARWPSGGARRARPKPRPRAGAPGAPVPTAPAAPVGGADRAAARRRRRR